MAPVMIFDSFSYNPFSEIRFETIDTDVEQVRQVLLPPFLRGRVGEIYRRASGLPDIGLKGSAVRPLHKVPFSVTLDK